MKNFARIAAAAIGGIAVTLTLIQMQPAVPPQTENIHVPVDERDIDPVRSELPRCQGLGAAGADDARCLAAWAEMRSRFFRSSVAANPSLLDEQDAASTDEPSGDAAIDPDQLDDLPIGHGN